MDGGKVEINNQGCICMRDTLAMDILSMMTFPDN